MFMLKREYANRFITSANPYVKEITISFKQDCTDLTFDPFDASAPQTELREVIDVAAISMTYDSAKQLAAVLLDNIKNMDQFNQETNDGKSIPNN